MTMAWYIGCLYGHTEDLSFEPDSQTSSTTTHRQQ